MKVKMKRNVLNLEKFKRVYKNALSVIQSLNGKIFSVNEPLNKKIKYPLDENNNCTKCNRHVVGLKVGDMHDHTEKCPDCGREREVECPDTKCCNCHPT